MIVLPSTPGHGERVPPGTKLAGVPLVRRTVLAAGRAGFRCVLVSLSRSDDTRLLAGTAALPLIPNGSHPLPPLRRLVVIAMNVVPHPRWLRSLCEFPAQPERLYVDGTSVAVVETKDPERIVAAAARSRSMAELVAALGPMSGTVDLAPDGNGRSVLGALRDVPAAEAWLLRGLVKPSEGFMSRHFERHLSLALTRRFCATRLTPNVMTLVSVAVGLLAAPFFLSSAPAWQLAGALLFLTHSILDGCDGELARLKFLESRTGAMLDTGGDNLVHVAVFSAMAVGWSLDARAVWPLLLGAVTVVSTAAAAAVVYGRGMRASTEENAHSPASRLADALAHRDFIYLIVLLAAFGKARWFLFLTAVGAPTFLLLLAWVGRRRGTS
ncbi:MAG: CDP-alcohol phosphatidyltransferase family protein [Candidatus Rokubacteria bacterium]|nr:CDP-alcohol phosphatidyltransferase family protein [Candidatus Rokubacteria bacterium]